MFAPPALWEGERIGLEADEAAHLRRVLRIEPGAQVAVVDGEGTLAHGVLVDGDAVRVLERERRPRPRPELVVYQGAAKGRKVDGVVERLAQLGVAEVRAFASRRAVVRWDEPKRAALARRWAAIARAAAKQSRNPFATVTGPPLSWDRLLAEVRREPLALTLWEDARTRLRALVRDAPRIALVVGPEGGLERDEVVALAGAGAPAASLGEPILRTENAALVAVSALGWHFGLIG